MSAGASAGTRPRRSRGRRWRRPPGVTIRHPHDDSSSGLDIDLNTIRIELPGIEDNAAPPFPGQGNDANDDRMKQLQQK